MALLVFIPIVIGIALFIIGNVTGNFDITHIGLLVFEIGIPVTMFALVVIGLILMITGKLNLSDEKAEAERLLREKQAAEQAEEEDDEDEDEDDDEDEDEDEDDESDDENKSAPIAAQSADKTAVTESDVTETTDSISTDADDRQPGEREKEYAALNDVNTSYGYSSRYKEAEYNAMHAANAYKNAKPKERILGWIFGGFLLIDFFMIMVFAFLRIFVGMIVCFCIFGGTILTAILVTVIRQKISMSGGLSKNKHREALDGVVKLCTVSSTTSSGSGRTTRINKVVYRVVISANDSEYTAYTTDFYETGDKLKFGVIGKSMATIIEDDESDNDDFSADE